MCVHMHRSVIIIIYFNYFLSVGLVDGWMFMITI